MLTNEATPPAVPLAPVAEAERINSVDVLRGVAVLGILLMNIVGMGLPDPAYWDPSGWGGATGWNLGVWWLNSVCFEGTMRAIFSMLFGAGVLLFTGKETKDGGLGVADAWYRRTIWLFLFGIVHAYVLLWPGEILYAYGLMGLFLFPFRNSAPGRLLALGFALLAIGTVLSIVESQEALRLNAQASEARAVKARGETPSAELAEALEAWDQKAALMQPSSESKQEYVEAMQGGYLAAMKQRAASTYWMQSEYHYRYSYFDVLSMMFIGMALLKLKVLQAGRPTGLYVAMVLAGYLPGIALNWYETATYARHDFALVTNYQLARTYDAGRLAMVMGHVGLVMLFCRSGWLRPLKSALAAVGRMALTNYLAQTVITTTIFVGLRQFGRWERHQLYYLVLSIWLLQLVVSPLWLRRYHFGPAEWLWRSLTYLRRQPFARRSDPCASAPSDLSS